MWINNFPRTPLLYCFIRTGLAKVASSCLLIMTTLPWERSSAIHTHKHTQSSDDHFMFVLLIIHICLDTYSYKKIDSDHHCNHSLRKIDRLTNREVQPLFSGLTLKMTNCVTLKQKKHIINDSTSRLPAPDNRINFKKYHYKSRNKKLDLMYMINTQTRNINLKKTMIWLSYYERMIDHLEISSRSIFILEIDLTCGTSITPSSRFGLNVPFNYMHIINKHIAKSMIIQVYLWINDWNIMKE